MCTELNDLPHRVDRQAATILSLQDDIQQLAEDASTYSNMANKLRHENTKLQAKIRRQRDSIRGQEKLWLQTKVSLLNQIAELQKKLLFQKFLANSPPYGKFAAARPELTDEQKEALLKDLERKNEALEADHLP